MLYAQKICILFLALKRLYFDWNVVYLYVPIFIILNTDQIGKKFQESHAIMRNAKYTRTEF